MDGTESVSGGNSVATPAAPTSFAEAFAAETSPASDTPAQQTDATAAAQPDAAQADTPAPSDERSPFIPRARFDEVNTKLAELKAWREQYGWVEQLDQQQLTGAMEFYRQFDGDDPVAALQQLSERLMADPTHGPRLKSYAAKTLAARAQQATDDAMPQPDVEITDGQGNVTGRTYSDRALAARDAWLTKQVLAQVEQKYAPIARTVEEVAHERAHLKAQHEASQFATGFLSELSQLPGFHDHKAAIAQEIAAMRLPSDNPAEVQAAAYRAYVKVALPALGSKAQSQLLDNLQQKAAASTSVNPGSAAPSTARAVRSFHELGPDAWK